MYFEAKVLIRLRCGKWTTLHLNDPFQQLSRCEAGNPLFIFVNDSFAQLITSTMTMINRLSH